jgi:hypothetical protein
LFNIKVVVILSAAVSLATGLAKEADAPIRMDHAVVELARGKSVSGLYIASTNGFTYLGINGEIEGLSNRGVTSLRLSHPPEKKAGSPESIADRVFDAVTGLF